ncbi:hypothetical protein CRUP_028612, partial [Coryphaenoides rupestris]
SYLLSLRTGVEWRSCGVLLPPRTARPPPSLIPPSPASSSSSSSSGQSEDAVAVEDTLDLAAVAKATDGYLARDLALLLERAVHAGAMREEGEGHGGQVSCSVPPGVGLDRVGGLREVRQELMDTILLPAKYPILYSRLPIRHRSGVLLYGAPGTGKTLLASAVARDSGMNFISI